MSENFYKYIQDNGPEAFDKMAADLAKQLNEAKAKYEAEQKKLAEEKAKKETDQKKRANVVDVIAQVLEQYYGGTLPVKAEDAVEGMLKAIDEVIDMDKKVKSFADKLKVIKDETRPDGTHQKVVVGNLSDLSEEELVDFWNGIHDTFFKD